MNVTYIDVFGHVGGGQVVGRQIIEELILQGYNVNALIPIPSRHADFVEGTGVSISTIEEFFLLNGKKTLRDWIKAFGYFWRNFKRVWNAVKKSNLVYVNNSRVLPLVYAVCFLARKPFIFHLHLVHSKNLFRFVALLCRSQLCYAVFVCSNMLLKISREYFASEKIFLLENTLQTRLSGLPFKNRFDGVITVGYFGGDNLSKGIDRVILAAEKLPSISFYCFGFSGRFVSYALVEGISIPSNVQLKPFVFDIGAALNEYGINVLIMPSRVNETFGLLAIEAAALSCIPIVSKCEAHQEIARELQCFIAEEAAELVEQLSQLALYSAADLADEAKQFWCNANARYARARFGDALSSHLRLLKLLPGMQGAGNGGAL